MRFFGRLLALLLIVPAVELFLLIQIGKVIGFWPTIGIILVSGLVGSYLVRREGLTVWRRFNGRLAQGGLPGRELLDGIIVLVSGVLLLTPGVITDLAGLIGLFPPTRALIRKYVSRRAQRAVQTGNGFFRFGMSEGPMGWSTPEPPEGDPSERAWGGTPSERPRHTEAGEDWPKGELRGGK